MFLNIFLSNFKSREEKHSSLVKERGLIFQLRKKETVLQIRKEKVQLKGVIALKKIQSSAKWGKM